MAEAGTATAIVTAWARVSAVWASVRQQRSLATVRGWKRWNRRAPFQRVRDRLHRSASPP